jgi:hypothetical protein
MGLFSKPMPCPICREDIGRVSRKLDHWETHIVRIAQGEGAGNYTWRCQCGPSSMHWPSDIAAAAGLGLHMQQRHGLSIV